MKTPRNPSDVHAPLAGYTHQIEVQGPVRWLVLSGQAGRTVDGHVPDLVKLTLYLVGESDPARRREVFAARLGAHAPCMTLVTVVALATPIYKVEVDAWAARGE